VHWLEALDFGLFRFINQTLSNPVFDVLMPVATGDKIFLPFVIAAGLWFAWKGGRRARLCMLMLALVVPLGDGMVCINLKKAVARPRPFVSHEDVRVYGGKNKNYVNPAAAPGRGAAGKSAGDSMPSAHAMNSFCVAMIFALYYRRSWRFTLPAVCLVAFSRVYNGMHYPSDVLAGAILGAGFAVAGVWALNSLWRWAGRRWFPLWWEKQPSLVEIKTNNDQSSLRFASARHRTSNIQCRQPRQSPAKPKNFSLQPSAFSLASLTTGCVSGGCSSPPSWSGGSRISPAARFC
jgi:undecaprenyl-diphosphatase